MWWNVLVIHTLQKGNLMKNKVSVLSRFNALSCLFL